MTDFEALGGAPGVRALVAAYVERFAADFIIGFLFEGRDLERIIGHEADLAARHLGGPARYAGRPLDVVHRPLRINAGHFRRRLAIVRTVLRERGVDEGVIARWIAAEQRLEAAIVDGTDCAPPAPPAPDRS